MTVHLLARIAGRYTALCGATDGSVSPDFTDCEACRAEATQRQGRERMLGLWRSAVACVEDASRAAEERTAIGPGTAPLPVLKGEA